MKPEDKCGPGFDSPAATATGSFPSPNAAETKLAVAPVIRKPETQIVQLRQWHDLFLQPFGYDAFIREIEQRINGEREPALLLDENVVICSLIRTGQAIVDPLATPRIAIQLSGMTQYFIAPETLRHFTQRIVRKLDECGDHVLLLDDQRVLFQVLPHQRTMNTLRKNIARMLVSKPKIVEKMIGRLEDDSLVATREIDD